MKRRTMFFVLVVVAMLFGACRQPQKTIEERNNVIGIRSASSNFQEAAQISKTEDWKDIPNKIVNVYIINPVTGGLLISPIQCMGVPNSSTESLEPNEGGPWSGVQTTWRVPVDGVDVSTTEMAGRDGTFGDPVHFRSCMGVDGNYYDWPAYGALVIVTSASFTFPEATVKRDFGAEARLLKAEEVIKRGGCINPETLEEIPCKQQ